MKISGFTFVRKGVELEYPFIESIKSILPICDEVVVAVGDSSDGTREAIVDIGSPKIKIIDTVWDERLRKGGEVLAVETNKALDAITGDWGLYIQADEVFHEKEIDHIKTAMEQFNNIEEVEGLIFPYKDFWGYNHILTGRRSRVYEVRAIKTGIGVRSYKDAQGFRIFPSNNAYTSDEPGRKIKVKKVDAHIYHYSRTRPPEAELKKVKDIQKLWHDDAWIEQNYAQQLEWDYNSIDQVVEFPFEAHPALMKPRVEAADWKVDPTGKTKFKFKNWAAGIVQKLTGWNIGEYRNFKLVK